MSPNTDTHSSGAHQSAVADAPPGLFETGEFFARPKALSFLASHLLSTVPFYDRHITGDWNEMEPADREQNETALLHGREIRSRFVVHGQPIWIITEADRSSTTVLLPEEY